MNFAELERIAVPVLAGMGNGLMAQPMVRHLAAAASNAKLVVFARNASIAGVFERCEGVAEVRVFGNDAPQFARLLRALRRFAADLLVVPYPSNRWQYTLLANVSGASHAVLHRYEVGRVREGRSSGSQRRILAEAVHDVPQNLNLLRALGIAVDETMAPTFAVREDEFAAARARVGGGRRVAIHAGSGETIFALSKRWPPEQFAQLLPRLRSDFGLSPILLEGPEDHGVGELIRAHVEVPVLKLTGPLHEAAAVLKACKLYVGSDSGLAHLAAAVGTPPVTLFGPARPDEVSPFGYRHLVVQTPARCAPCFDYPRFATTPAVRCRPPYCIGQITIDRVLATVARALER